ncbi:hypothetical protein PS687_00350 [Pseudomonas fluorescens]|nr:hypothetical protein PS687_00350 [Pseudomonas fluorescens]
MLRTFEMSAVFLFGCLIGAAVFWYFFGSGASAVNITASGNVGDWVSALASFSAAAVALWLALNQRSRDRAICKFDQQFANCCWTLTLISEGLVPATVIGVYLVRADTKDLDLLQFNRPGAANLKNITRGSAENIVDIDSTGFQSLLYKWGAPYLEKLKKDGESPADYEAVAVNESYFEKLQLISNKALFIKVVTLHKDYKIKAPKHLVGDLVARLSNDLREKRLQEIRNHTGRDHHS